MTSEELLRHYYDDAGKKEQLLKTLYEKNRGMILAAAREIASVMEKHYDHYTEHIWPEQRRILEAYCAQVTALFEESRFSERAEEAVGCALPAAAFHPTMVNSIEHGAEAIDISEDQDVFGIARDPETAFRFIGHEFIIYLLKHALPRGLLLVLDFLFLGIDVKIASAGKSLACEHGVHDFNIGFYIERLVGKQ